MNATELFNTKRDGRKLNCAQAITLGFSHCIEDAEEKSAGFQKKGGGRTPGGTCGAYYAAESILYERKPEAVASLQLHFHEHAGDVRCRDIRKAKKASCDECVGLAQSFLDEHCALGEE